MFIIRYPTLVSRLIIYYTDDHNVNEDITAITSYGGNWDWASGSGITMRFMTGTPSSSASNVASRRRHLKMFIHYTDQHSVDEDLATITSQGGRFGYGTVAGVAARFVNDHPASSSDVVASSDISKLIKYYSDNHEVDEDMMTVSEQGGRWNYGDHVGITRRDVASAPSYHFTSVAYKKNKCKIYTTRVTAGSVFYFCCLKISS